MAAKNKDGEVATPKESVVTASGFSPPKVAEAPLTGVAKVTVTPGTGMPPLVFTIACNGKAKNVALIVLCGVPPVAVIVAPGPSVFVSEKLAGVVIPVTVAVAA